MSYNCENQCDEVKKHNKMVRKSTGINIPAFSLIPKIPKRVQKLENVLLGSQNMQINKLYSIHKALLSSDQNLVKI